jgi:regulatory protein
MTRRDEDAVETAIRALRHRDRSTAELDARLAKRGIDAEEREQALETRERVGYVDDERFARTRAEQLAARSSGDALIRHDLEQRGVAADVVEAALGSVEPERERAQRLVAQRGATLKTARYLAARGFGEEALEGIVAHDG